MISRQTIALCAVALVCAAIAAPVANVNPDAIVAEEAVAAFPSSGNSVPAPALSLVGMRTAMKGLIPNAMALQNIQQLKGYCVAAIDQALDMLEQHKTAKLSALVQLIAEFGANAASKELVVEYGQMMNKLKAEFDSKGLPIYLLDHLDQAVLSGEGIITTTGSKARFNSEDLGFQQEPEYIESLEVSLSDYTLAWTTVSSASSGADNQAALECLQAGTVQKYSTFLDQIQAKYAQKAQEYWEQVVHGAMSAEADAFDSTSTLDDQSPAGLGGAEAVIAELEGKGGGSGGGMQMPSDEEMNAEAEKMAKDWASGNLKTRCADVVEDVDELETGEVVECKMIAGSYGSDAEIVVTADKGEIKVSFGDDTGTEVHGSIASMNDTTCDGSAEGPETSMHGDTSKAHKFSYDDATHTITWEDGSTWIKYTPPADDVTSAPVSPPAEEACKAYVLCAAEHGTCSFEGSKTVRYGLNGHYKEAVHSDGVACNNGAFGDPIVGTVKSCFVQEDVPCDGSWSYCIGEGGTCSFSGTKMVRYGAVKGADEFWYAEEATGSIACSTSVFGDPLPGTGKACYTFESESLSSEAPSEAPSTDEASPTALTCPEGTEQVGDINADIPGCGLLGCSERYNIDTIEDCESACAANSDCVAFTWAPVGGDRNHMDQSACTQYDSAVPTSTWAPNQIFCKMAAPKTCVQSAPISARQSYTSVDLSQPSFTVSLWLNLASDSNDLGIFSYGRYSTCGFMCQTRTGSQGHSIHDIHCRVSNGNGGLAASNSASNAVSGTPGTWEHITVVKDAAAGQISFYVNGVSQGTNSYSTSSESCSDPFYLGGWPGDSSAKYLDGQIAGVVVSDVAMTASEVADLYSSTESTHLCPGETI